MSVRVQGLELLYDPALVQITGLELEFSHETYRESGAIFDPSCTFLVEDQDRQAAESATTTEVATVGVSGADQGSGGDALDGIAQVAESLAAQDEAALIYADQIVGEAAALTDVAQLIYAEWFALETGQGAEVATLDLSGAESLAAADAAQLLLHAPETATGEDQATLIYADWFAIETGQGADSAFLPYADHIAGDTGAGVEAGQIGVSAGDEGSGSDVGNGGNEAHEIATGTDAATLTGADQIAADTGAGIDAAQLVYADWFAEDTAIGTDAVQFVLIDLLVADTATTSDEGTIELATAESASGDDLLDAVIGRFTDEFIFAADLACAAVSGDFFVGKAPRLGPEIYWPSWTRCHTSVSLSGSANRTFNFYQFWAEEAVLFNAVVEESYRRRWLPTAPVRESRAAWVTSFAPGDTQEFTVRYQVQTPMGPVTGTVRQALSPFDYETAVDPVWWVDGITRRLTLRNLHMREARRTSFDGVYSLCMELYGVTPDSGVYWRRHPDQTWEWIDAESPVLSGDQFTLPLTGTLFFAWGSEMLLRSLETGTVTIEWMGGRTIHLPVTRRDVPNRFDGYGRIIGLPRLRREDNLAYKRRLLIYAAQPADPTLPGVVRGVAARIGTIGSTTWDGVSTLTIDASGASGVSQVTVVGVARFREVEETLFPAGDGFYYARYPQWRDGWLVMVDGVPEPGVSVSGNVVRLTRTVSGAVTALYAIEQYQLEPGVSGTIRAILPGTGLPSGGYRVLYTRDVRAYNAGSAAYQAERLQDAQGLPNRAFHELANQLAESNPTVFGRARWGMSATWLDAEHDNPQPSRLPVPMDLNLDDP